jgi:hypothetical protein
MKRILIVSFIALMSVVLVSGVANAKITSTVCVDCHTMHNSQGNLPVAQVWTTSGMATASGPYGALLNKDCIACHYSNSSETVGTDKIPKVFNTSDPTTKALAAGNFYHVAAGYGADNAKGHNVAGIADAETAPMDEPPGFKAGIALPLSGSGPASWAEQLTCAGIYGCHGRRTTTDQFGAIRGGHHGDDSTIDGTTIPRSYRFLSGILGEELNTPVADRWEYPPAPTSVLHNAYKGESSITASETSKDSISYLCAECHWYFHSQETGGMGGVGTGSPWLRHPTDIAFSTATGASSQEYLSYTTYDPVVPVGWTSPTGNSTQATVNSANTVICLSCHRAHASPNNDLLRWNYEGVAMTGNSDCKTCHTTK